MSFRIAVQAFDAKVGNPLRKLVLLKLADQANDDGLCWPSYDTVAKACEISRRSVIRHIQQLEEDGFLRIERVYDKEAKKNKSNRYHLTITNGEIKSLVTESHHPSDTESPLDSDTESLGSDTESPKPIIESISKPIIETKGSPSAKKPANDKFKPVKPEQVSDQTWNDLLALRKKKRAVESQTAWTRINNSIERAQQATGHTLENIFSYWVMRAWAGFDEKWYINAHPQPTNTYQGNTHAAHQSANSQYQPKQSQADSYAANLDAQLAAERAAREREYS